MFVNDKKFNNLTQNNLGFRLQHGLFGRSFVKKTKTECW